MCGAALRFPRVHRESVLVLSLSLSFCLARWLAAFCGNGFSNLGARAAGRFAPLVGCSSSSVHQKLLALPGRIRRHPSG
ncbi:hypothetical protein J3E69DRAFT_347558 [Trichoderma sp. SZMC 28015]